MIFYKNIFVSTILSVILLLGIVAYVIYNSKDKTGNNGVMIIITREKEIEEELHTDIQTLINFYNNNINKLIYDNFNNIYLLDNTVIYNNAVNAFKKRLETETDKETNFRIYEDC